VNVANLELNPKLIQLIQMINFMGFHMKILLHISLLSLKTSSESYELFEDMASNDHEFQHEWIPKEIKEILELTS